MSNITRGMKDAPVSANRERLFSTGRDTNCYLRRTPLTHEIDMFFCDQVKYQGTLTVLVIQARQR